MKLPLLPLPLLLPLLTLPASATVVVTQTVSINSGFTVASSDLLQSHLASALFSGSFNHESNIGVAAFNNGVYGSQGNQGGMNPGQLEAATADGGSTATFILDSGTGFSYDLTSVTVFAGWDRYRGGQQYSLYYDTVNTPGSYQLLASVFNHAVGSSTSENVNTRSQISDTSGVLAAKVRSLRFQFGGDLTFGFAGYREIDVNGIASVPQPSAAFLTLLCGAAILRRNRPRKVESVRPMRMSGPFPARSFHSGTWTLFVADQNPGDTSTLQGWTLTVTAVPEPGTVFLGGLGVLLLLRRRRP